jgi:hypothetical protein
MAKKRHKTEEIVAKLRKGDVLTARGQLGAGLIRLGNSPELGAASNRASKERDFCLE